MNNKKITIGHMGIWGKVITVSFILFFVYLGDGILSDWVPSYIQDSMNSSLAMGLILSFSSVVGFGADLIFPALLKMMRTRKLLLLAIGASLVFSGILLWTILWPWLILFLIAMAVWGIYYEFLGFGTQQFVNESIPPINRSGVWAVMGVFKSLAYFLGPIIGSYIALSKGNNATVVTAVFFVFVGYLIWVLMEKRGTKHESIEVGEKINILTEAKHWRLLSKHVWPVLVISLVMGIIDATFWTTGTVLSDNLAKENWMGGMFLPFYMLPMVIFGIVVARWGVYKGKKKLAEIFMLVGGLVLALVGVANSMPLMLVSSFLTGTALAIAWPLTEAVYTDIVNRMGKEGKHMMGLSSSTVSLAYIIGPVLAGGIAQFIGEKLTFSVMGVLMALVALILLVVTPRKLRLPQVEIQTWS